MLRKRSNLLGFAVVEYRVQAIVTTYCRVPVFKEDTMEKIIARAKLTVCDKEGKNTDYKVKGILGGIYYGD